MTTESVRGKSPDLLVIAHRGASADHPENTLAAFDGAADQGADWVELDARPGADGAVVVHHDALLPDGRPIVQVPSAELPAHVPTLSAALACCSRRGLGVNVEIKALPGEPDHDQRDAAVGVVLAAVAHLSVPVLATSFDPACVDEVRRRAPGMPVGQLTYVPDGDLTVVRSAAERGCAAVNPWAPTVTQELVDLAHARGLAVYPWTADHPRELRRLMALGVDGIITNVPSLLARLRRAGARRP